MTSLSPCPIPAMIRASSECNMPCFFIDTPLMAAQNRLMEAPNYPNILSDTSLRTRSDCFGPIMPTHRSDNNGVSVHCVFCLNDWEVSRGSWDQNGWRFLRLSVRSQRAFHIEIYRLLIYALTRFVSKYF